MGMVAQRFDVFLVDLEPTRGSEIRKVRPCLVISPDDLNGDLRTVIVAPMTTKGRKYSWRVECHFAGKDGQIALDQVRTVDKARLIQKLGRISPATRKAVLAALADLFAE